MRRSGSVQIHPYRPPISVRTRIGSNSNLEWMCLDGCVTGAAGGGRSVQPTNSADTDQLPAGSGLLVSCMFITLTATVCSYQL